MVRRTATIDGLGPARAAEPAGAALSVVVPATDDPSTIDACRRAILAAVDPPEELLVVERAKGEGAAHARNAGVLDADGSIIVFVDSDVAVHPDAFVRIRSAFAHHPELIAMFGSYDDAPSAPGVVSVFRNLLHHHVHQTPEVPAQTFWTGLGAIRRDAFEALGGFDTAPRWRAVEDIELGVRLAEAGCRIELDPTLCCTHMKAWTLGSMLRTDLMRRGAPWVSLLISKRRVPAALNLRWRHRVSALCWVGAASSLAMRRPTPAVAALASSAWLNRSFYGLLRERHGDGHAALGFLLHGLHHLTAAAAVPVGVAMHLRHRRAARRPRAGGYTAR